MRRLDETITRIPCSPDVHSSWNRDMSTDHVSKACFSNFSYTRVTGALSCASVLCKAPSWKTGPSRQDASPWGAILEDRPLRAGCFSSGAGPASTSTSTPLLPNGLGKGVYSFAVCQSGQTPCLTPLQLSVLLFFHPRGRQ